MRRREFIRGMGVSLAGLAGVPLFAKAAASSGKAVSKPPKVEYPVSSPTAVPTLTEKREDFSSFGSFRILYLTKLEDKSTAIISLRSDGVTEFSIPLSLTSHHSLTVGKINNPSWAFCTEASSPTSKVDKTRGCLVDLKTQKVHKVIGVAEEGNVYPGHAYITEDEKVLYVPEYPFNDSAPGVIVARSIPDLTIIAKYYTGCYKPHNLLRSVDGKTLIVGHYGRSIVKGAPPQEGGIALLELPSGKLKSSPEYENPYLAFCHLDIDDAGGIYVSSRMWSGDTALSSPVFFGGLGEKQWIARLPKEFAKRFLFNFSIKCHRDKSIIGVSHFEGNLISFWNTKSKTLSSVLDLKEGPLGLDTTPDGRFFIANTSGAGKLLIIDAETRNLVRTISVPGIGWSPHINVLV